jgi:hypothetical protein
MVCDLPIKYNKKNNSKKYNNKFNRDTLGKCKRV